MDKNIELIKKKLGTGSIDIFGLPLSGKDTVGLRLAEAIGGKMLSSGLILRAAEKEDKDLFSEMSAGKLAATDKFREIVLPYLKRPDLAQFPLILSSVGRWEGEEYDVIEAAKEGGHPIKAVILLNISEAEAKKRWEVLQTLQDRGDRSDDKVAAVLDTRIKEFIEKTMPVIETYRKRDILLPIFADTDKETVYQRVIEALAKFLSESTEREIPLNYQG